jgi:hypothetical protein
MFLENIDLPSKLLVGRYGQLEGYDKFIFYGIDKVLLNKGNSLGYYYTPTYISTCPALNTTQWQWT